jgi:hypothetical protein
MNAFLCCLINFLQITKGIGGRCVKVKLLKERLNKKCTPLALKCVVMHTHVGKQLKRKGLKVLCAKLVVMYYLVYGFMGFQQRFHLSTSSQ